MEWKWEELDKYTCRAKVFGGWLVQVFAGRPDGDYCSSMCFVSDPKHEWVIDEKASEEAE